MSKMIVYQVLHQCHDDETGENGLNCGFFPSQEECQRAIAELIEQPGFRDYPNDFNILEFPVDTVVKPGRFLTAGNALLGTAEVDPEMLQYLWHAEADDEYLDFAVTIGVFSSANQCRRAIAVLADEPEFRDYREGFEFEAAPLGVVFWQDGFHREPVED